MNQLEEDISRFIKYIHDEKNDILKLIEKKYFKRVYLFSLLFSLLDTLSISRYSRLKYKNRKRFIKLINNDCSWDFSEDISLPQLIENIKNLDNDGKYNAILDSLNLQINKFTVSRVYRCFQFDKQLDYYKNHKLYSNLPEHYYNLSSYPHLLWKYRCKIVHEFKKPGGGIDMSSIRDSPYYHSFERENSISWELIIPHEVICKLIDNALNNLEKYFLEHKMNPYDSYNWDECWNK